MRLSFKLNLAGVGLSVLDGALQEVLYASASGVRCSVYLLYWYKSTNTDWKTRDIRAQYALGTRDDI